MGLTAISVELLQIHLSHIYVDWPVPWDHVVTRHIFDTMGLSQPPPQRAAQWASSDPTNHKQIVIITEDEEVELHQLRH